MIIKPSALKGTVQIPSSKSIGHRVIICAGLASGESRILGIAMSKDILATMEALKQLGAKFEQIRECNGFTDWKVDGIGHRLHEAFKTVITESETVLIECGESGSTLRFMIPVVMGVVDQASFAGEGRLVERPIDEFFPIFKASNMTSKYSGKLPLYLEGRLKPGSYQLSGKVSSQYTSGMLLAAPLLGGETVVEINGNMESKAYIDLTIDTMKQFGVHVERRDWNWFGVSGDASYSSKEVSVEGDYSQAAFWIVAGLIGGESLLLKGLNPSSVQGDREILEIAVRMGGKLTWSDEGLLVESSATRGVDVDASQCPDLIPVVCVLAALSSGVTRVYNGERLRVKESDRILSTVTELKKMGADIEETQDGMIVKGTERLKGGCSIDSWNDHRIVMAMTVASLRADLPINIIGHEAVNKSYPRFFEDFSALGGLVDFECTEKAVLTERDE